MAFAVRTLFTAYSIDMTPFTGARALRRAAGLAPHAAIASRPPRAAFSSNPLTFVK